MDNYRPEAIYLTEESQGSPLAKRAMEYYAGVPVSLISRPEEAWQDLEATAQDPIGRGKRRLLLDVFKGPLLKRCPGTRGLLCCNYYVFNIISGCPFDCSYCILQYYLSDNPALRVFTNLDEGLEELEGTFRKNPHKFFRVGTGELTDSLALEGALGLAERLVPFFARWPNALLELKTKSARVEPLLALSPSGRTVVAWSLNPQEVIEGEERGTASLNERLRAAELCQREGYLLAFHFDPIIIYPGWEGAYRGLLEKLFSLVRPQGVAWVSLGGLRFPRELKRQMEARFPGSRLTLGELIPSPDGKLRYLRRQRVRAYRLMVGWLRGLAGELPVYLCMEGKAVWRAVLGNLPGEREDLKRIFKL